ncbi:hypothetical protein SH501x_000847 [Pirellulaceae bacterium SH501]
MSAEWLRNNPTDEDLRASLKEIDESDCDVTGFEALFIESVLYKSNLAMTPKQRSVAKQIIEKYGD